MQTHEEEAEAPAEEVAPQEAEMEVAVTQAAAELVVTVHTTDRVAAVPEAEAAAEKLAEVVCGREVPEEEAEMEVLPAEEAAEVSAEDNEPITKTEVLLPDQPPFKRLQQATSGTNRCLCSPGCSSSVYGNPSGECSAPQSLLIQPEAHLRTLTVCCTHRLPPLR